MQPSDLKFTASEKSLIGIMSRFYGEAYPEKPMRQGIFIVGGFLRDRISGLPCRDIDFIAYGIVFDDLDDFLEKNKQSLKIEEKTKAAALTSETGRGKLWFRFKFEGLAVDVVKYKTKLIDDCYARDFKLNSLFYDIFSKKLIDYADGYLDVRQKVINPVESFRKTFADNYSRFLRMLALFDKGFTIADDLASQTKAHFSNAENHPKAFRWVYAIKFVGLFKSSAFSKVLEKALELNMMLGFAKIKDEVFSAEVCRKIIGLVRKIELVFSLKEFKDYFVDCAEELARWSDNCSQLKKVAFPFSIIGFFGAQGKDKSCDDFEFMFDLGIEGPNKAAINYFFKKYLELIKDRRWENHAALGAEYIGKIPGLPFLGLLALLQPLDAQDVKNLKGLDKAYFEGVAGKSVRAFPPKQTKVAPKLVVTDDKKEETESRTPNWLDKYKYKPEKSQSDLRSFRIAPHLNDEDSEFTDLVKILQNLNI